MQVHPVILLVCIPLLWLACAHDSSTANDKQASSKPEIDSLSKEVLQLFTNNGYEYVNDSNCLSFYRCGAYDTSSLVQIKKHGQAISGVYYVILPNYHRFISDYSIRQSKLLFFEGYSFTLDSTAWQSIVKQAKLVLQEKIDPNAPKYTDGTIYGLLYNQQIQRGRTGAGDVSFDRFDRFLKDSFLDKFMQARKPIMYKKAK